MHSVYLIYCKKTNEPFLKTENCSPLYSETGTLRCHKGCYKSGVIADGVRMGSCRVTTKRGFLISKESVLQNEMLRPMSPRELLRRGRPVPTALRSPRKGQRAMRVKPLWFSAYARYARALKALARSFALCETRSKLLVSRVPCRRERRADSLILPGRHLASRHFCSVKSCIFN